MIGELITKKSDLGSIYSDYPSTRNHVRQQITVYVYSVV